MTCVCVCLSVCVCVCTLDFLILNCNKINLLSKNSPINKTELNLKTVWLQLNDECPILIGIYCLRSAVCCIYSKCSTHSGNTRQRAKCMSRMKNTKIHCEQDQRPTNEEEEMTKKRTHEEKTKTARMN